MGLELKSFEEIRDDMIDRLTTLSSRITDFNVGSVIRNFLVAVAAELDDSYYKLENAFNELMFTTATGENLDNLAAGFGVSRSGAQKAYGMAVFGRSTPYGSNITIPAGTEISTDPEGEESPVGFDTDDAIVLLAGNVQCSGWVTALEAGAEGNVNEHTVTKIVSVLPLIDAVDNPYAFAGGTEETSDDEFREQFVDILHSLSKGTVDAVESSAKACPGILSAKLQENDPSAGYCKLYVATSGGTPTAGELAIVQSKIEGYVRPVGVAFTYYGAVRVGVTVTATVTKETQYNSADVKDACEEAINEYLLGKGMSEDVLQAEIISVVMDVAGVTNIGSLLINGAGSDLSIDTVEVARPDSISITVV